MATGCRSRLHFESASVHELRAAGPALANIRVPRRRGRPRTRPGGLAADKGYERRKFRQALARQGIRHSIPVREGNRAKFETHKELSGNRWKVERFFAWLKGLPATGLAF